MTSTYATPSGRQYRMSKASAPFARRFAGKAWFPLWANLHHVGRKTGRDLTVPIAVRETKDGVVIALPLGPGTNWARNVMVAGTCTLTWKGGEHTGTEPRVVGWADAERHYTPAQRYIVRRVLGADHFLLLAVTPAR